MIIRRVKLSSNSLPAVENFLTPKKKREPIVLLETTIKCRRNRFHFTNQQQSQTRVRTDLTKMTVFSNMPPGFMRSVANIFFVTTRNVLSRLFGLRDVLLR